MAIEHAACWPSTRRQLPGGSAPSRAVSGTFADQRSAMLPAIDRASAGHAPRTTSARCDARVVPGTTPAQAIAPAAPNARNHAHEEPSHGKARPPAPRRPRARRGPRQPTATTEAPAVKHHLCALMMPPTVSRPMSPHSVKRPVDRVRSDTHQERIATAAKAPAQRIVDVALDKTPSRRQAIGVMTLDGLFHMESSSETRVRGSSLAPTDGPRGARATRPAPRQRTASGRGSSPVR